MRDPYKRLGIERDASSEEIQEARNYLVQEYSDHEKSRESIEQAYDRIIAEKFLQRKKTKINLKVQKFKQKSRIFINYCFTQFSLDSGWFITYSS